MSIVSLLIYSFAADRRRAYDRGDLDGRGFEEQEYAPFPGFHASICVWI